MLLKIVTSPARGENRMCSHPRTSDATDEKIAACEKFNELNFLCDKITDFVAKCSHHGALATRQFSKKSHHHRKQKLSDLITVTQARREQDDSRSGLGCWKFDYVKKKN